MFIVFLVLWSEFLTSNRAYRDQFEQSREMFFMLNIVQAIATLCIVPLISASAINREIEKNSWDLLASTPLSHLNIVFGKLFSSMLLIWIFMLALVPIYGISIMMGGVAPGEVMFIFLIATELIVTTAAIGLYSSIRWKRTIQSISMTFVLIFFVYFIGPILIMNMYNPTNQPLGPFIFFSPLMVWFKLFRIENLYACSNTAAMIIHLVFALSILYVFLFLCLRRIEEHELSYHKRYQTWNIIHFGCRWKDWLAGLISHVNGLFLPQHDPLALKELKDSMGWNYRRLIHSQVYLMGGAVLLFVLVAISESHQSSDDIFGLFILWSTLITPCMVLPYAVNSFRSEIDRDTWDLLKTTLLTPWQIFIAKKRVGMDIYFSRFWAYYSIVIMFYMLIMVTGDFDRPDVLMIIVGFMLILFVSNLLFLSIGLLFSAICKKTTVAYCFAFVLALGILLVPFPVDLIFDIDFVDSPLGAIVSPTCLLIWCFDEQWNTSFFFMIGAIQVLWMLSTAAMLNKKTVHVLKHL